jgi:hypothetical protein
MPNDYKNNHYVPEWYQKRFLLSENAKNQFHLLDLNPGKHVDSLGKIHTEKPLKLRGTHVCFAENDLYLHNHISDDPRDIEKQFFGEIDTKGKAAVEYFEGFSHPSRGPNTTFTDMLMYMSTQKLRTPKALEWLSGLVRSSNREMALNAMLKLRQLHCAIWAECVWLIADASNSDTKFIVSDHPVTVYNRVCGPRSPRCRGSNDPEIWLNGTHTIFPLSSNKVLIMTNLSWVRNPYQSAVSERPHPDPFRGALFKITDIQTLRYLTEQEVVDINYVIKRRAFRYIAAAKEEWLYPEKSVSTSRWNELGNGYLLMPDPRPIHLGGEVFAGFKDGRIHASDEYGRTPDQHDYNKETNTNSEQRSLYRFKGEFARLFGPYRRGRSFQFMHLDPEQDDDETYQNDLNYEKRKRG